MLVLVPLAVFTLIAGTYAFFWNPDRGNVPAGDAGDASAPGGAETAQYQSVQALLTQLREKLTPEPSDDETTEALSPQFPNLELLGTIIARQKDPIAFIRDIDENKQGVYRMGSSIKGAQIIMIGEGSVLLAMNDATKELRLATRRTSIGAPAGEQDESQEVILAASDNRYVISKRGLAKSAAELTEAVVKVAVKPYKEADQVVGMVIDDIPEGSIISSLGIKNRDVVTSINNQKLRSYQNALQIAQKARGQQEISVVILRAGKAKELSYRFAQ